MSGRQFGRNLLLLSVSALALLPLVAGCGFTTHNLIARRAKVRQWRFRAGHLRYPQLVAARPGIGLGCGGQDFFYRSRLPGYEDIIRDNPDAVLGVRLPERRINRVALWSWFVLWQGAPFPDYLYTCGSNHDDGEWVSGALAAERRKSDC